MLFKGSPGIEHRPHGAGDASVPVRRRAQNMNYPGAQNCPYTDAVASNPA
jgi:hypothetical protein